MNWSLYTADRLTHLKIVVVGLLAAIILSVLGITTREYGLGNYAVTAQDGTVIRAGDPMLITERSGLIIR